MLPVPSPSSFLTISSTPTIPISQIQRKTPILTISSIPTKQNPQIFCKNPIFFTSVKTPSSFLTNSSTPTNQNPQLCISTISASCLIMEEAPVDQKLSFVDKVQSLASEFRSLSEPIDRVKRLLHYASILPPLNESAKVQENRVLGCTTQVWLEVRMDNKGCMRFRVDSDSEITKGFCSCLIWVLDGAEPDEVLRVTAEDLADMNVGLPRKGRSRVNTWHNVLFSMQNRTLVCVQEKENLHSLVVRPHGGYVESEAFEKKKSIR